jgi:3-hydroxymyristoyl/3-hydroxydecanoyl-(acyl carrier protein) dehydratase
MDDVRTRSLLHWEHPFLMIDALESWVAHERVVTRKVVTEGDPVLGGGDLFPAVLLLEGLSQSAALLFRLSRGASGGTGPAPRLGWLEAQLHASVGPGGTITFDVRAVKMTERGGVFEGRASDGGKLLAEAELAFAVPHEEAP